MEDLKLRYRTNLVRRLNRQRRMLRKRVPASLPSKWICMTYLWVTLFAV